MRCEKSWYVRANMTRKIAFISTVSIKLPREAESEIEIQKDDISIEYKHPVLYVTKYTKNDKDYINIYCGEKTYVLMKIREHTLNAIIPVLKSVLQKYLDGKLVEELEAEIRLYCLMSNIINEIFNKTLRDSIESFKAYLPILLNFDPLLRRELIEPLAKSIAKVTLRENIREYYLKLPGDILSRLSFKSFSEIMMSEIPLESIVNGILSSLKSKDPFADT
ncbi:MAG: hypothetical protein QXE21_02750 [Candidatus Korarchaeota archaeon]